MEILTLVLQYLTTFWGTMIVIAFLFAFLWLRSEQFRDFFLKRFKEFGKDGLKTYPPPKIDFELKNDSLIKPEIKSDNFPQDQDQVKDLDKKPNQEVQLLLAMYEATANHDANKVIRLSDQWMKLENKQETIEMIQEIKYEQLLNLGYPALEKELKDLTIKEPLWFFPNMILTNYYLNSGLSTTAEIYLNKALEQAHTSLQLYYAYANYSEFINQTTGAQEACDYLIEKVKDSRLESADKVAIYQKIAKLKEKQNDTLGLHLALERALQIEPNNTDIRFELAYSYAKNNSENIKNDQLSAYHHYKKLLLIDANNTKAMNNLALVCKELDLKLESDYYIEKAISLNESYTRGNLIIDLANAGFYSVSKEILNKTPEDQRLLKRIMDSEKFLHEFKENEDKKNEDIQKASIINSNFIHKILENKVFKNQKNCINGTWHNNSKENLVIKTIDFSNKLCGTYHVNNLFGVQTNYDVTGYFNNEIIIIEALEAKQKSSVSLLGGLFQHKFFMQLLFTDNETIEGIKWTQINDIKKIIFKKM